MHKIIDRPLYIFLLYLGIIALFSILYCFAPCGTFKTDLNIIEAAYLSVITITTLGYGDITPMNDYGMITTSLESILGILIIGTFINSSWKGFSEDIEKKQSEKIKASLTESNKSNILSYNSYLHSIISEYRILTYELTTPLSKRGEREIFSSDFLFSDLQDFLSPSLLMKYSFNTSVIEIYYRLEENLINELKYVLANFGLEEFQTIKSNILLFLNVAHGTGVKDALLQYTKRTPEDNIRTMLIEMIKRFDSLPPEEYHRSNAITPIIALYRGIQLKMKFLDQLESEIEALKNET